MKPISIQVCILAHNEESRIAANLERLIQAHEYLAFDCWVIVNGSNDRTAEIVRQIGAAALFIHCIELAEGGKANAWNHFFTEHYQEEHLAIFIDGDVLISPVSIREIALAYQQHQSCNALVGLPSNPTEKARKWCQQIKEQGGIPGNLYALSPEFLARLKRLDFILPKGLVGDDSLLAWIAGCNLEMSQEWSKQWIVPVEQAEFEYEQLSATNYQHLKAQYKRMINYSVRRFQNLSLRQTLLSEGVKGLPKDIASIYPSASPLLKLKWRGVWTWFDHLALKRIRSSARND